MRARRPQRQRWIGLLAQQLLLGLVHGYRLLLKPWVGNRCRFDPSCSAYALEALQRHGAVGGSAWAVWRVLRCHPGCAGGDDPLPDHLPRLFTGLLAERRAERPTEPAIPTRKSQ